MTRRRRANLPNNALPQKTGAGAGSGHHIDARYAEDEVEAIIAIRSQKARLNAKKKAMLAAAQGNAPVTLPKIGWGDL